MPSADLDQAVKTAVTARTINNGQSCIAAKRFIVHEKIADEFTQRFVTAMESLRVGDPMNNDTDIGPISRDDLLAKLDEQAKKSMNSRPGLCLLTAWSRRTPGSRSEE